MRERTAESPATAARPGAGTAIPRRVLIVSYEYPPLGGGGGVIFRDLAEELARHTEVAVLTSGRADLPGHERLGGVEIIRTPVLMRDANATASLPSLLSFFPSSLVTGYRLLRERRYDLIHSSFAVPSAPSGLLLARRFGLPHVLSIHGGDLYDPSKKLSPHRTPLLKQTVAWVLHRSDRVVAQSSDTVARARDIYRARAVDCVPLAVKPISFKPRSRSEFGWSRDGVVLITVGRLVARKGLGELLEIVASLDESVQLAVVGDGPLRPELERQAQALGIAQRVQFCGFVTDEEKWQRLAAADLYVSTTQHEGFGIVFLEAMETGLPVICYDRGGQVDFVDAQVGALVPLGDREKFTAELRRHVDDPRLRSVKGSAARACARGYHVDRFAERYLQIYAECLSSPTPHPGGRASSAP
jgi:glycosyltransferase involved in cell wall biosynthesis